MEVKLFYKTQRELSFALNELIDAYWEGELKEDALIDGVMSMYENNQDKLIRNNDFTKIVQQQSGKRRLAIVERILKMT